MSPQNLTDIQQAVRNLKVHRDQCGTSGALDYAMLLLESMVPFTTRVEYGLDGTPTLMTKNGQYRYDYDERGWIRI